MTNLCKLASTLAASSLLWNAAAIPKVDAAKRPQEVRVRVQTVLLKGSDTQQQGKALAIAFSSPQNAERFLVSLRRDLARQAGAALASPISEAAMTLDQTSLIVVADPTPGQPGIVGILAITPQRMPNGELKLTVAASHIVPINPSSQWFVLGDVVQTGSTVLVNGLGLDGPDQPKLRAKPRLILLLEIGTSQTNPQRKL